MTTPSEPTPPPSTEPTPQQTTDPYQQGPGTHAASTYAPTPRARTSPWVWAAIGTLALGVIGSFALTALFYFGGWFAIGGFEDDEYFDDEFAYYSDQGSVARAMEPACDDLRAAASSVRPFASTTEARAALQDIAEASLAVSTAIDGASPDRDSRLLSADWRTLGDALDTYAEQAGATGADFRMPEVDGEYVSERILMGNDYCYVPNIVMVLDPDTADLDEFGAYAY